MLAPILLISVVGLPRASRPGSSYDTSLQNRTGSLHKRRWMPVMTSELYPSQMRLANLRIPGCHCPKCKAGIQQCGHNQYSCPELSHMHVAESQYFQQSTSICFRVGVPIPIFPFVKVFLAGGGRQTWAGELDQVGYKEIKYDLEIGMSIGLAPLTFSVSLKGTLTASSQESASMRDVLRVPLRKLYREQLAGIKADVENSKGDSQVERKMDETMAQLNDRYAEMMVDDAHRAKWTLATADNLVPLLTHLAIKLLPDLTRVVSKAEELVRRLKKAGLFPTPDGFQGGGLYKLKSLERRGSYVETSKERKSRKSEQNGEVPEADLTQLAAILRDWKSEMPDSEVVLEELYTRHEIIKRKIEYVKSRFNEKKKLQVGESRYDRVVNSSSRTLSRKGIGSNCIVMLREAQVYQATELAFELIKTTVRTLFDPAWEGRTMKLDCKTVPKEIQVELSPCPEGTLHAGTYSCYSPKHDGTRIGPNNSAVVMPSRMICSLLEGFRWVGNRASFNDPLDEMAWHEWDLPGDRKVLLSEITPPLIVLSGFLNYLWSQQLASTDWKLQSEADAEAARKFGSELFSMPGPLGRLKLTHPKVLGHQLWKYDDFVAMLKSFSSLEGTQAIVDGARRSYLWIDFENHEECKDTDNPIAQQKCADLAVKGWLLEFKTAKAQKERLEQVIAAQDLYEEDTKTAQGSRLDGTDLYWSFSEALDARGGLGTGFLTQACGGGRNFFSGTAEHFHMQRLTQFSHNGRMVLRPPPGIRRPVSMPAFGITLSDPTGYVTVKYRRAKLWLKGEKLKAFVQSVSPRFMRKYGINVRKFEVTVKLPFGLIPDLGAVSAADLVMAVNIGMPVLDAIFSLTDQLQGQKSAEQAVLRLERRRVSAETGTFRYMLEELVRDGANNVELKQNSGPPTFFRVARITEEGDEFKLEGLPGGTDNVFVAKETDSVSGVRKEFLYMKVPEGESLVGWCRSKKKLIRLKGDQIEEALEIEISDYDAEANEKVDSNTKSRWTTMFGRIKEVLYDGLESSSLIASGALFAASQLTGLVKTSASITFTARVPFAATQPPQLSVTVAGMTTLSMQNHITALLEGVLGFIVPTGDVQLSKGFILDITGLLMLERCLKGRDTVKTKVRQQDIDVKRCQRSNTGNMTQSAEQTQLSVMAQGAQQQLKRVSS